MPDWFVGFVWAMIVWSMLYVWECGEDIDDDDDTGLFDDGHDGHDDSDIPRTIRRPCGESMSG